MNFIKGLVSGKRNRFKDGDVDLDLTYITPRIIAMSYPAEGMEGMYRNHIQDVGKFLDHRHPHAYMVFNLSERHYDNSVFGHRVVSLGFPDHHAPPVEVAWTLCLTMHAWLQASPQHVVVVHCLAGKGRTGAIIACYMLFAGMCFSQPNGPGQAITAGAHGTGHGAVTTTTTSSSSGNKWAGYGEGEDSNPFGSSGAPAAGANRSAGAGTSAAGAGAGAGGAAAGATTSSGAAATPKVPSAADRIRVAATVAAVKSDAVPGAWLAPDKRYPTFLLPPPAELAKHALVAFRAARGEGVKNPSQERTVRYFARVIHGAILAAHRKLASEDTGAAAAVKAANDNAPTSKAKDSSSTGAKAASATPASADADAGVDQGGEAIEPVDWDVDPWDAWGEEEGEDGPQAEAGTGGNDGQGRAPASPSTRRARAARARALAIAREEEPTWVLWRAAEAVRDLKALPLPKVATLRINRIIIGGLPSLQTVTVADAAFGTVPSQGTGEPPLLCLTTAPYQGAETRMLFNSSWHERDSVVFSPADLPLPTLGLGASGQLVAASLGTTGLTSQGPPTLGTAMYSLHTIMRGDVLLTCRAGGAAGGSSKGEGPTGGSALSYGGSTEVFRASFHSSFVVREGHKGVYRLTKRDVDQDKKARHGFPLSDSEFFVDVFYSVVRDEDGIGAGNTNSGSPGQAPADRGRGDSTAPQDGGGAQGRARGASGRENTASVPGADEGSNPFGSAPVASSPGSPSDPSAAVLAVPGSRTSARLTGLQADAPLLSGSGHDAMILACGWLWKRGHLVRNWKRRWCVLRLPSDSSPWGEALAGMRGSPGPGLASSGSASPAGFNATAGGGTAKDLLSGQAEQLEQAMAGAAQLASTMASTASKAATKAFKDVKGSLREVKQGLLRERSLRGPLNSGGPLSSSAGAGGPSRRVSNVDADADDDEDGDGSAAGANASVGPPVAFLYYFKSPGHPVPKGVLPIYRHTAVVSVDDLSTTGTGNGKSDAGAGQGGGTSATAGNAPMGRASRGLSVGSTKELGLEGAADGSTSAVADPGATERYLTAAGGRRHVLVLDRSASAAGNADADPPMSASPGPQSGPISSSSPSPSGPAEEPSGAGARRLYLQAETEDDLCTWLGALGKVLQG